MPHSPYKMGNFDHFSFGYFLTYLAYYFNTYEVPSISVSDGGDAKIITI